MTEHPELTVFDLETTGVDVETARIVTAAVAVLDVTGDIIDEHEWLVDPGVEIPDEAAAVHGITTQIAQDQGGDAGPSVNEIYATLATLTATRPLVIYNAPYDLTVLDRELRRYDEYETGVGLPAHFAPWVVDPLVLDKQLDPYRKGKRTLTVVSELYGIPAEDAHNAFADAIMAGQLAHRMLARFEQRPRLAGHDLPLAEYLHRRQIDWKAEQAESFQDYLRRTKDQHTVIRGEWPWIPYEVRDGGLL